MNITRENIDDLNAVIRIGIEPADYQSKVEASIAEYRKKARFDGFRPGKVPPSLVRKLYGKTIQIEEVQHLLTDTVNQYIHDNQLKILGEPLPNAGTPPIDWENQDSYEFHFDIALAPEIDINITEKDKINDYEIQVTPEIIDKQIEDYARRFGSLQPAETATEEDAVTGDLCQVGEEDDENSIHAHGTRIYIQSIADDKVREKFIGIKAGDQLVFNPNTAFPNESDRAALLRVKKEELGDINSDFEFTVGEVSHFTAAEIDQELFDKVYGEGTVDSIEAFRERISEDLERRFSNDSRYKFHLDAKARLMEKTDIKLPEEFLKRWMLETSKDEKLTGEQLETEFPAFAQDLKWRMIKNRFIDEQKLEATDEEMREQAIWTAQSRYFQYGIYNAQPDQLFNLAEYFLKDQAERNRISDTILENKVIDHVKTLFGLVPQKISQEDFNKLMDESK